MVELADGLLRGRGGGKAVILAGGPGAGQAAKICNNMLLGATMVATCEAFVLAQKLGLNLQTFYDISSKASGQSWSMTSYCPLPGVGPKTATKLIQDYGDLESALAAAPEMKKSKLQERLIEQADQARLSRVLVTLKEDCALPMALDDFLLAAIPVLIGASRKSFLGRLLADGDEDTDHVVLALHRYLGRTPSRLLSLSLADAVGEVRTQNQPGTTNEYPNWRVPLTGPDGEPMLLEDVRQSLLEAWPGEPTPD